jgi:hypothetical protein
MKRILISTVVVAVILFMWGFVAWAATPMHRTSGWAFDDETAVGAVLKENAPVAGTYWIPAPPQSGASAEALGAWTSAHESGPLALVMVHLEGRPTAPPLMFIQGFVVNLVAGFGASLMLWLARGSLASYASRVAFVTILGVVVAGSADLKYWTFLFFPTDWSMMNVLDHLIAWLLSRLAMAAIIKPKKDAA